MNTERERAAYKYGLLTQPTERGLMRPTRVTTTKQEVLLTEIEKDGLEISIKPNHYRETSYHVRMNVHRAFESHTEAVEWLLEHVRLEVGREIWGNHQGETPDTSAPAGPAHQSEGFDLERALKIMQADISRIGANVLHVGAKVKTLDSKMPEWAP